MAERLWEGWMKRWREPEAGKLAFAPRRLDKEQEELCRPRPGRQSAGVYSSGPYFLPWCSFSLHVVKTTLRQAALKEPGRRRESAGTTKRWRSTEGTRHFSRRENLRGTVVAWLGPRLLRGILFSAYFRKRPRS